MGKAKDLSKAARRAVTKQAAAIREQVAQDVVMNLYTLPLMSRIKWAIKIIRGLPLKESLCSWALGTIKQLGIKTSHLTKLAWRSICNFGYKTGEGKIRKGGVNQKPTTPRPSSPIGQGGKDAKTAE